jgi:hypothetical protein
MEAAVLVNYSSTVRNQPGLIDVCSAGYIRRGDDDFSIDELLVEFAVLALLIGGRDECVALVFEPFADAQLVFCRS